MEEPHCMHVAHPSEKYSVPEQLGQAAFSSGLWGKWFPADMPSPAGTPCSDARLDAIVLCEACGCEECAFACEGATTGGSTAEAGGRGEAIAWAAGDCEAGAAEGCAAAVVAPMLSTCPLRLPSRYIVTPLQPVLNASM